MLQLERVDLLHLESWESDNLLFGLGLLGQDLSQLLHLLLDRLNVNSLGLDRLLELEQCLVVELHRFVCVEEVMIGLLDLAHYCRVLLVHLLVLLVEGRHLPPVLPILDIEHCDLLFVVDELPLLLLNCQHHFLFLSVELVELWLEEVKSQLVLERKVTAEDLLLFVVVQLLSDLLVDSHVSAFQRLIDIFHAHDRGALALLH